MGVFMQLNNEQQKAVLHVDGPLLILAGAGSGKTRVLTNRIARLISECNVSPWNILAITFTNKAADEMRERIDDLVGLGSESIWVATFHSTCVRILRRFIDRIGYDTNFSIYDADDQKNVMKEIIKRRKIDTKMYKERFFLNAISSAKDELVSPEAFKEQAGEDFIKKMQADIYEEYQKTLHKSNALDFDDLIYLCVKLLKQDKEVRDYYQDRFRYISVDEYQDTNTAQFELVRLLAGKYKNLCVVGDDDQSIYKFRGANIKNILNFEKHYPNAKVIKLEQNYRSTQNILDAANAVISHNMGRKEKRLWTDQEAGDKIGFYQFDTAYEEAEHIAYEISSLVRRNEFSYGECAILYRTNAQSRLLEEKLVSANIPYKIIGGINFYSRKEIKDVLAYLKTIENGQDDLAVRRIINVPKRGIGATTIGRIQEFADEQGMPFFDACRQIELIPTIKKAADKIRDFANFILVCRAQLAEGGIGEMTKYLLDATGYIDDLRAEHDEEADARIENIEELLNKITDYEETAENPTLTEFLDEVSLVADIDNLEEGQDYVALMTLHSAKGLEFANVYISGMEDGLFPSYMTITADDESEMEEERRLAYVGITRAKKRLTLTCAKTRMTRGEMQYNKVSRFLAEIPKKLLTGNGRQEDALPLYQQANRGFAQARKSFRSEDVYGVARAKSSKAPSDVPKAKNIGNAGAAGKPDYNEGDRVRHPKFGEGTVTSMVLGGRDYEVTVDFDDFGTKKMFAQFAKMNRI
ncbi:MAG: DNA helicase PcrA [Lachnospiraceae bacterium]|nr:DNA helicase PcrA [Lachnospiraceae bacterium]